VATASARSHANHLHFTPDNFNCNDVDLRAPKS